MNEHNILLLVIEPQGAEPGLADLVKHAQKLTLVWNQFEGCEITIILWMIDSLEAIWV